MLCKIGKYYGFDVSRFHKKLPLALLLLSASASASAFSISFSVSLSLYVCFGQRKFLSFSLTLFFSLRWGSLHASDGSGSGSGSGGTLGASRSAVAVSEQRSRNNDPCVVERYRASAYVM